jgi:hypothetical protein
MVHPGSRVDLDHHRDGSCSLSLLFNIPGSWAGAIIGAELKVFVPHLCPVTRHEEAEDSA